MNLVKLEQVHRVRPWAMPECEDNETYDDDDDVENARIGLLPKHLIEDGEYIHVDD